MKKVVKSEKASCMIDVKTKERLIERSFIEGISVSKLVLRGIMMVLDGAEKAPETPTKVVAEKAPEEPAKPHLSVYTAEEMVAINEADVEGHMCPNCGHVTVGGILRNGKCYCENKECSTWDFEV